MVSSSSKSSNALQGALEEVCCMEAILLFQQSRVWSLPTEKCDTVVRLPYAAFQIWKWD